ncbi:MAG: LCP family protein [Ruminococcus sp.]
MAKKKKGRIAIPFLLTMFISLIIIGGAALFIYNYLGIGKEKELEEPIARNTNTAEYEDSHTILLILNLPEEKCPYSFVMMRSVPSEKKLLFVGIPSNTIAVVDGQQARLDESFARGGAASAVSFSEQVLGVDIDKYMIFGSDALLKACDIIGGVTYSVKEEIVGFDKTTAEQYLNGSQIQTYLTYPMFEGGEEQRAYTASSLLAAMINQSDLQRLADGLDRSFNTIINLVESDITAVDYKNNKNAVKYMLERGSTIARFRIVTGKTAAGDFIPDNSFREDMIKEYFTDPDSISDETSKSSGNVSETASEENKSQGAE